MVQAPRVTPFDLHVLGRAPAFVLFQDQTLVKNSYEMPLVFYFVSSLALPLLSLGFSLFSSHSLCSFLGAPPCLSASRSSRRLSILPRRPDKVKHKFSKIHIFFKIWITWLLSMGYPQKNGAFCSFLWITSSKRKRKAPIREPWPYSSTTTNASGPAPQSSHSKSAGSSVWPSGNSYTQSQTVHLIFITVSSFYLLGTTPIIELSM